MTDEKKPTPNADALAQEVADLLTRRAGLPAQPAPEAAPVPADAPEPFKPAVAAPWLSKRVVALVGALLTLASRRLGVDPELLAEVVEVVLVLGLGSHWWTARK